MSESKGPYIVVAYPVNHTRAFHVKDGPEVILSFGTQAEAEDARARLNAAYAAGAAAVKADMERNMQFMLDALAEAGYAIDRHRSPSRSQEKVLTEALLETVSRLKEAREQRDANGVLGSNIV